MSPHAMNTDPGTSSAPSTTTTSSGLSRLEQDDRAAHVSSSALWASAFVLAGLLLWQLARPGTFGGPGVGAERAAMAGLMARDSVTRVGEFSIMTFDAGSDDVLAVMDGRSEELFAYRVRNQNTLEFIERQTLPDVFATGRKLGAGRGR